MPGVSKRSKPPQRSHRTSRVTPALSPVFARFCPLIKFTSVLLPVLGIPATINRNVFVKPFASARARFSSVISVNFCKIKRLEDGFVQSHLMQYFPLLSNHFKKPSVLFASAKSALFKRYKTGFSPNIFLKFLFTVAIGARASSTQIIPSHKPFFSSMSRMARVICPGNHCIFFIFSPISRLI